MVDSLDAGGAERYVVDLALTLQRKGYEVTVACSVGGPPAPCESKRALSLYKL